MLKKQLQRSFIDKAALFFITNKFCGLKKRKQNRCLSRKNILLAAVRVEKANTAMYALRVKKR